jgi:exodeoxyribonuclease V alpha subunit
LELSPDDIDLGIASLIAEEAIIIESIGDDEAIYLAPFYYCEVGINNTLNEALSTNRSLLTDQFISQAINQIESKLSIHLAVGQQKAISTAANAKAMILTGGPGTGKTTTTIGMICLFEMLGQKIILAAPTGRAAKRLSEMTQREAKTIHRLLEFSPQEMGFKRNRENPLEADVVIIDEMSMVDLVLMNNLIKAIPLAAVIILIGDVDQLPSVGAGNVLKDLISCGRIEVVELTEIFRQAQESMIITNAHRINSGKFPQFSGLDDRNFFFIEEEDPDLAAEKICELVKDRLPTHYNYHPMDDIQVLCPMRRSSVGSENLNILLQNALNGDDSNQIGTRSGFRINDKVMQIRNNYDLDVFNGDIGRITNFSRIDKIVEVTFPEKTVNYDMLDLSELVLSYATTIHKSQGSEYTAVVIPLMTQHYIMLQRNLVYTGITRAKKLVVIVGTKQAMTLAIRNNKVVQRNTNLATRLSVTDENLELKLDYEELLIDDLYMNSGSNFLPPSSVDQA